MSRWETINVRSLQGYSESSDLYASFEKGFRNLFKQQLVLPCIAIIQGNYNMSPQEISVQCFVYFNSK